MSIRQRPLFLHTAFALVFAVIANLAWATAITTAGPWYGPAVSMQVYALAASLSALLAVVLTLNASRSVASLEASLRHVDRRVALFRAKLARTRGAALLPDVPDPAGDVELDGLIDGLLTAPGPSRFRIEKSGHDTLVSVPEPVVESRPDANRDVFRGLEAERVALREARAHVWAMAAGPVVACLAFLAIAAAMLPGSDGFATAHYQLNTALILFLSYGLSPLVAWALLVLGDGGRARSRSDA